MKNLNVVVPIVETNKIDILNELYLLDINYLDIIELRLDFLNNITEVIEILPEIRQILKDKLILATFRTQAEGGEKDISDNDYLELNKKIIETKLIDLIDTEVYRTTSKQIIDIAHQNNIKVVTSYHNFNMTESNIDLIKTFKLMDEMNGDILKIAQMPKSKEDVTRLKDIKKELEVDKPLVLISMSELGLDTRIKPQDYSSIFSFGSGHHASAPGQINYKDLYKILNKEH